MIGCFMALQQVKVVSASTLCRQLTTRRKDTQQKAEKNTRLKLMVYPAQVTQHTLLVVPMYLIQIDGKPQVALSMHDIRVYLKSNTTITLLMFPLRKYAWKLSAD